MESPSDNWQASKTKNRYMAHLTLSEVASTVHAHIDLLLILLIVDVYDFTFFLLFDVQADSFHVDVGAKSAIDSGGMYASILQLCIHRKGVSYLLVCVILLTSSTIYVLMLFVTE